MVYTRSRFRTFPNSGTWHSVIVALPPALVSGDINLEEVLATKVGPLEGFCTMTPLCQKVSLKEVLGDASELPQMIMDCVSGVATKVRLGQVGGFHETIITFESPLAHHGVLYTAYIHILPCRN